MWFFTMMITTKTDVIQMIETSVLRAILQVLLVCWQKRSSLTGFSIVGSNRTAEDSCQLDIQPYDTLLDQDDQDDQDVYIPQWLAAPIEEDTF